MCAHILRGYGLAREQGYFKQEQEAELQKHRQRLVKEGKLPEEDEKAKAERERAEAAARGQTFDASVHAFETLPEVLQQQARVDDPHALRRKQYERRIKGEPEPLTEAELRRARTKMFALGAAVGHVPRMSMGRNRFSPGAAAGAGELVLHAGGAVRELTPEAREVAARTYVAGVRALVYGSVLGAIGLAAAATWAVRASDIKSGEELGERMRSGLAPLSESLRGWLVPLKDCAQAWVDGGGSGGGSEGAVGEPSGALPAAGDGGGGGATAEFSRRLQERYNPRKAGGEGGGAADTQA